MRNQYNIFVVYFELFVIFPGPRALFAGQPQPGVLGRGGKAASGLESPAGAIEEVETGGRLPLENEKKSGGDKYSKLAGNTLIFAISSFSSKLLTLIVQPFLTYAMAEISDLGLSKPLVGVRFSHPLFFKNTCLGVFLFIVI